MAMYKLTNYYALRGLKCLHLLATIFWCGGTLTAMLLNYTVGLSANIENILHIYLIRPGIWLLIAIDRQRMILIDKHVL